jgi:hypothetical protein
MALAFLFIHQAHNSFKLALDLHGNPILIIRKPSGIVIECHVLMLNYLMHLEP